MKILMAALAVILGVSSTVLADPPAGYESTLTLVAPTGSGMGSITMDWRDDNQAWITTGATALESHWYVGADGSDALVGYYDQGTDLNAWTVNGGILVGDGTFDFSGASQGNHEGVAAEWGDYSAGFQFPAGMVVPEPAAMVILLPTLLLFLRRPTSVMRSALTLGATRSWPRASSVR